MAARRKYFHVSGYNTQELIQMKEDILEQIFDDWLRSQPSTFTKNNVKFRPNTLSKVYDPKKDSSFSDIDILGIHLNNKGIRRVSVATCKSWQNGFNPENWQNELLNKNKDKRTNRPRWKYFRELVIPKWSKAFREKIIEETQCKDFTYFIVVTKLVGKNRIQSKIEFENQTTFLKNLSGNGKSKVKIQIITFEEIFKEYFQRNNGRTLESTMVGRLLQVIKASGIKIDNN